MAQLTLFSVENAYCKMSSEGSRCLMSVRFSCKAVFNFGVFLLFCIVDLVVTKTACVIAEKSIQSKEKYCFFMPMLDNSTHTWYNVFEKNGAGSAEVCKKRTALY